jgi:uncharacterized membrane protein
MRLWLIPLTYALVALIMGFGIPRLEQDYFAAYSSISPASAQAFLSSVASGMMALTGIVFSVAFVMVQFSAIAYSPRLVMWFARDPSLFHSLGFFIATFIYSLWELFWIDRGGSGKVPWVSTAIVVILLICSMGLFARLIQRVSDLTISNVLEIIGDRGREVLEEMFERLDEEALTNPLPTPTSTGQLGPAIQTIMYYGEPRAIAQLDLGKLVRTAKRLDAVFVMARAVGDTLFDGNPLLYVHGVAKERVDEARLMRAVQVKPERTFQQDPKYPLRLLVDIAIKALSPAINDPTTAVQALDQIEDLLLRLGRRDLDAGYARDRTGKIRLIYPMPTWEDYLALAFDEIRHYGAESLQVMRRLRSTLVELADSLSNPERAAAVRRYMRHLDLAVERMPFDDEDRAKARQEDRQGLGLTRKPDSAPSSTAASDSSRPSSVSDPSRVASPSSDSSRLPQASSVPQRRSP